MPYQPDKDHRHSLRLRHYDYTAAGMYFVTICVEGRRCRFGTIIGCDMNLNAAGRMVEQGWTDIDARYPAVSLDGFVTMPNHVHAIVLVGPHTAGAIRLGDVIGVFKSLTTNAYIRGVREGGWPPFAGRLWQRNYYEHVIRDDDDLERIRTYVHENPAKWAEDRLNPAPLTPSVR